MKPTNSKDLPGTNQGFTLVEILIVMVLIGLSISIVIPNIGRAYDKIKFKSETKKIYELLQKAKFYAFYYQKDVTISVLDRRLVVHGLDVAEGDIPAVGAEMKAEISFSSNGVTEGGEVLLFLNDAPKAVIRIEEFSGRLALTFL